MPTKRLLAYPRWRAVFITVAIWLGVVSIFVAQRLVGPLVSGRGSQWLAPAVLELAYWIPWLLLVPLLLALARRFPLASSRWRRNLLVHLAASLTVGLAEAGASVGSELLASRWLVPVAVARPAFTATLAVYTVVALWKYWVFLGIVSGFAAGRRARERALQAAHLESQLTAARLQTLEARLHPHFLFNTLHSASMLTLVDPEAASRLLARLADLLRLTLHRTPAAEVTLEQELELVERYLDIERIRFPDRLRVDLAIAPELRAARVPNLLLQPLVENAIRHGIAPTSSAGHLTIRGRRNGPALVLEVDDDGPGPPPGWVLGASNGLGLAGTAARLALLYPGASRLDLACLTPGGCRATIVMPFAS